MCFFAGHGHSDPSHTLDTGDNADRLFESFEFRSLFDMGLDERCDRGPEWPVNRLRCGGQGLR